MNRTRIGAGLSLLVALAACSPPAAKPVAAPSVQAHPTGSFGYDAAFLARYQKTVILSNGDARVLVSPAYQGRVMTSSADGDAGRSYGWINYDLIAAGDLQPHINAFGGEDRFWLGPEGSRFSLFFPEGAPLEFEHWQTPAEIDSEPFELVSQSAGSASFRKQMELVNHAGTSLSIRVDREVALIERVAFEELLGAAPDDDVTAVAFETRNSVTNTGEAPWTQASGAPSIWILGMLQPAPATTVAIPFQPGTEAERGRIVTQDYFGPVPEERLIVGDGVLYFKADGLERGKIGVPPRRARNVAGSYDAAASLLTLVQYTLPEQPALYVNSLWTTADDPFAGDVVNSYNDGPLEDGGQLGPFYELESSSPAALLAPGETLVHTHRTFHFQGPPGSLSAIAEATLGVSIEQIQEAF